MAELAPHLQPQGVPKKNSHFLWHTWHTWHTLPERFAKSLYIFFAPVNNSPIQQFNN
jgi:hypothetical protein